MQEVQRGRRIGVTKRGYVGFTTHDTEKGDLLVILEGFTIAFVLRRKGDHFIIAGDCYIHGIMDDELVCAPEDKFELGESQVEADRNGSLLHSIAERRFCYFSDFHDCMKLGVYPSLHMQL